MLGEIEFCGQENLLSEAALSAIFTTTYKELRNAPSWLASENEARRAQFLYLGRAGLSSEHLLEGVLGTRPQLASKLSRYRVSKGAYTDPEYFALLANISRRRVHTVSEACAQKKVHVSVIETSLTTTAPHAQCPEASVYVFGQNSSAQVSGHCATACGSVVSKSAAPWA